MQTRTGSALITAGGQGRRIGYDKKRLRLHGAYIIHTQIETLAALFNELIISANDGYTHDKAITVKDAAGAGPMAGIYSGLAVCKSEYLFVTACDMPFISPDYIRILLSLVKDTDCDVCAVVREDGFVEPFNALYHKNTLPLMKELLTMGRYKMQALFKELNILNAALAVPPSFIDRNGKQNIFYNINYAYDLDYIS